MHQVLCFLITVQLLVLATPLKSATHAVARNSTYAEQAIFGSDPGSFLLIGLGLLAVGIVGTRALRS